MDEDDFASRKGDAEIVAMTRPPMDDDQNAFTSSVAPAAEDAPARESAPGPGRYSRRLSDKILIAFHHACDQSDFDIAASLLHILETMLLRRPVVQDSNRRRSMESLVAAYERLWHLRHPGEDQY